MYISFYIEAYFQFNGRFSNSIKRFLFFFFTATSCFYRQLLILNYPLLSCLRLVPDLRDSNVAVGVLFPLGDHWSGRNVYFYFQQPGHVSYKCEKLKEYAQMAKRNELEWGRGYSRTYFISQIDKTLFESSFFFLPSILPYLLLLLLEFSRHSYIAMK